MDRVYYSSADLDTMWDASHGLLSQVGYHLRSPMPQVFLVTVDPQLRRAGVCVRTATLTPLSWIPYTMAVTIPQDDQKVIDGISHLNAECVLALPTCHQLRQLTLCSQRFPKGVSEASIARFRLFCSQTVAIPGIEDCPVNFECRVDHIEPYYGHVVVFLKVTGASIQADLIFKERQEIVDLFPTNLADKTLNDQGNKQLRVSSMGDLFLCPTFPVAPKQGWYSRFDIWIKDLFDEGYFTAEEYNQIIRLNNRWEELFSSLDLLERVRLRENLTGLISRIVREDWDGVHAFLANLR